MVLRMRQKVVVPTLPLTNPHWVVDPDFDLEFHVRRVVLPAPGTWPELLEFAQHLMAAPFDLARPLWEMVLVEGVATGAAQGTFLRNFDGKRRRAAGKNPGPRVNAFRLFHRPLRMWGQKAGTAGKGAIPKAPH
jgi:hypothetical protein